jgi:hypothetical protein
VQMLSVSVAVGQTLDHHGVASAESIVGVTVMQVALPSDQGGTVTDTPAVNVEVVEPSELIVESCVEDTLVGSPTCGIRGDGLPHSSMVGVCGITGMSEEDEVPTAVSRKPIGCQAFIDRLRRISARESESQLQFLCDRAYMPNTTMTSDVVLFVSWAAMWYDVKLEGGSIEDVLILEQAFNIDG